MHQRRRVYGGTGEPISHAPAIIANYRVLSAEPQVRQNGHLERMQEELKRVIDELCMGELPPGRNLEQLRFGNRLYSVRLNRNFRFVFELMEDGTGRAIAVGPHDSTYETAKRAQHWESNE